MKYKHYIVIIVIILNKTESINILYGQEEKEEKNPNSPLFPSQKRMEKKRKSSKQNKNKQALHLGRKSIKPAIIVISNARLRLMWCKMKTKFGSLTS